MHELSLAESTLELALRHARQAGASRIAALDLVVGELTPLEEASLTFYWERLIRGTPAAGSRLRVRRIPARLECSDCAAQADIDREDWRCPACGSPRLRLACGDECYLESIDVEESKA
jgi:hydrogenase nickel incorporation protein HypA/HybF